MEDGFILLELESIKRSSTESDLSISKYTSIRDAFGGDQFKSMDSDESPDSPSSPIPQVRFEEPLLERPSLAIDPNCEIASSEPPISPAVSEGSESKDISLFKVILGCAFPCWLSFLNPEQK